VTLDQRCSPSLTDCSTSYTHVLTRCFGTSVQPHLCLLNQRGSICLTHYFTTVELKRSYYTEALTRGFGTPVQPHLGVSDQPCSLTLTNFFTAVDMTNPNTQLLDMFWQLCAHSPCNHKPQVITLSLGFGFQTKQQAAPEHRTSNPANVLDQRRQPQLGTNTGLDAYTSNMTRCMLTNLCMQSPWSP
jgi:hypothetical protein